MRNLDKFCVEFWYSCSLVGVAGTLTESSLLAIQLTVLISVDLNGSDETLASTSAITFLLPGIYCKSISYLSSLNNSL